MRTNEVKAKLKRGEPSLGAWLSLPGVPAARIMARLGFDWLLVDMEHSAQNPALMADMLGAIADASTSAPFVRVPTLSVEWFKWALDAGAWGIVVPMVNTRAEAERVIEYSKYPPLGLRSIGGAFGPYSFGIANWSEYARAADQEILVAVQIESVQALENLDEILSVPGIDAAFVGPNDLHAQLGLTPSSDGDEPEFVLALERIQESARKHGVALGIFSGGGEAAARRVSQGFQMVSVTTDISCMIAGAAQQLRLAQGEK
ncbi:MAG TPA: aldolase/citrate lyase family protein [Ktedonobacteraceae bacterium]